MSRQEAGRRDPGKSLAQPANSVSFFVNRRVSQASKATHFLLPCFHTHDVLVARDTMVDKLPTCPPQSMVTQVWTMGPAWRERKRLGHFQLLPGRTPPQEPGISGQWMPSFQEARSLLICIATLTERGTSLPHPPGLGCHIG